MGKPVSQRRSNYSSGEGVIIFNSLNIIISLLFLSSATYANEIRLHIYSNCTFPFSAGNRDTVKIICATLDGFDFKGKQVQLRLNSDSVTVGGVTIDGHIFNSSEDLQVGLEEQKVSIFPLHFHGKLNFLNESDALTVLLHKSEGEPLKLPLSHAVTQGILKYLVNDMSCFKRQCYDFVKEVFYDSKLDSVHSEYAFEKQIQFVESEDYFRPRETIVLFQRIHGGKRQLKHYAISLGHGIYISKFGNALPLVVTDLKSMMTFWKTSSYGRINTRALNHPVHKFNKFPIVEDSTESDHPIYDYEDVNIMKVDIVSESKYPFIANLSAAKQLKLEPSRILRLAAQGFCGARGMELISFKIRESGSPSYDFVNIGRTLIPIQTPALADGKTPHAEYSEILCFRKSKVLHDSSDSSGENN